jgi:hypothetical protein
MAMAVEVSTKPVPAISEGAGGEPRRLHLQSDDEQKEHHPQFGDVQDGLRVGEEAEPVGADHQAGSQVAEHRAEADPLEERHCNDSRRQQRDDAEQVGTARCGFAGHG